jgi:hypothetical protein
MIIDTDVILYGPLSARPAAIVWGGLYITSDSGAMYRYNGSTWDGVNLFPQSYLFAALPGAPGIGQMAVVVDSTVNTWGTAITVGGGTDKVLAWFNGSAWSVVGK